MHSDKFCRLTATNMYITDSTNSGGQMSCDKVVINLFWHDVMFYYPMEALLVQSHTLIRTDCLLKRIYSEFDHDTMTGPPDSIAIQRAHCLNHLFFLKWIYDKFESWLVPVVPSLSIRSDGVSQNNTLAAAGLYTESWWEQDANHTIRSPSSPHSYTHIPFFDFVSQIQNLHLGLFGSVSTLSEWWCSELFKWALTHSGLAFPGVWISWGQHTGPCPAYYRPPNP